MIHLSAFHLSVCQDIILGGIDEAFNKPAEFTYKSTVEKIEREKKNVENLVAFTRRENRKALGLYLDSLKE